MSEEIRRFYDPRETHTFAWNEALAQSLVDKSVIIGITHNDQDGTLIEHVQYFGTIRSVDAKGGIVVDVKDSEDSHEFLLPPAPYCFIPAERGVYTLRSTGETIENPDLITTWIRTGHRSVAPSRGSGSWVREQTAFEQSWDEDIAKSLVGKLVVLHITTLDPEGQRIGEWRGFGRILGGGPAWGIDIALMGCHDGKTYRFPPAPRAFVPAPPGRYAVPGVEDGVEDPDFTAFMVMQRNKPGSDQQWQYFFPQAPER